MGVEVGFAELVGLGVFDGKVNGLVEGKEPNKPDDGNSKAITALKSNNIAKRTITNAMSFFINQI